ncbi:MAG: hypothetical protein R3331_05330 [Sulfurospirillaceae bacterium]|nr:hypothetical protein [Sulfurospirillaceae bacterium]
MKKTILTTFLLSTMIMLFSGCGTTSMPSPEALKSTTVKDFIEGQGFSWNNKTKLYELTATKNRELDKNGDWTQNFKKLYDRRFAEYCSSQGGKIDKPATWQNKMFPIGVNSLDANTMIYGKLNDNMKSWTKISKLCTVNDIPIFGYSFSAKNMEMTRGGVTRDKFNAQQYKYNVLYKMAWDSGVDANIWWNIEAFAVIINRKDYEDAKLFISSYLTHNNFDQNKKTLHPQIQEKEYSTQSGFRRF